MKHLMRLIFAFVLTTALTIPCVALAEDSADEFNVSAKGVVVMDAETGKVIISKNMDEQMPPASTTKVMSAIVALEKLKPTDVVHVSKFAANMAPSKVYLRAGDEVTVEALLYAMLLKSANDSAAALAEGVAGSETSFGRMMTQKAHEIGAINSNFVNASGLPAENHYTTAYDLALILRYAMRNPEFLAISSTKFATLNMGERERMLLKNHNKLLWYYDGAGAGKTGYTVAARHCYVGEANCGNSRLIVAILRSANLWGDAKKLLDKGFELAMTGQTLALADTGNEPAEMRNVSYTPRSHGRYRGRGHRAKVRHGSRRTSHREIRDDSRGSSHQGKHKASKGSKSQNKKTKRRGRRTI